MARGFALVVIGAASLMTACSGGPQPREDSLATQPSATVTATGSATRAQAALAVEAYQAFWRAAINAQRHPVAAGDAYPQEADFARFSFDPVRATYTGFIAGLATQGVQFRGTPPTPRVSVISVEPAATPYPVVTLRDCQTPAPDWNEYVVATGKQVPKASAAVQPPYEITAKVIFYEGHWGVQATTTDTSRTCTA